MQRASAGLGSGLLGVIIFSGSMPATRIAVSAFPPLFLTAARASIAAALSAWLLWALRARRPTRTQLGSLAVVALGVVAGFPLLTALALQQISAARSLVFIGLLPLSTAVFAVWRGGERPPRRFWTFALLGSATVAVFALTRGARGHALGDLLMLLAVAVCGLGYAEGARLARSIGGWQVICWALVLAAAPMAALAAVTWPHQDGPITVAAWLALAYVSLFSMLLGFVFWYRGLARGGIAVVGQLQLLQPFIGMLLAAALVHETVSPRMLATALVVLLCVAAARRGG